MGGPSLVSSTASQLGGQTGHEQVQNSVMIHSGEGKAVVLTEDKFRAGISETLLKKSGKRGSSDMGDSGICSPPLEGGRVKTGSTTIMENGASGQPGTNQDTLQRPNDHEYENLVEGSVEDRVPIVLPPGARRVLPIPPGAVPVLGSGPNLGNGRKPLPKPPDTMIRSGH